MTGPVEVEVQSITYRWTPDGIETQIVTSDGRTYTSPKPSKGEVTVEFDAEAARNATMSTTVP